MLIRDDIFKCDSAPTGNAENVSLSEFIDCAGSTLLERVTPFSFVLRESIATGATLYSRELVGPSQHRSQVSDRLTGEVREMVMLGSNNYLGLTTHPKVRTAALNAIEEFGVGMGGPPLLSGMSVLHRKLEKKLAELKGGSSEEYDALLFGSGFQANLGWIKGLMKKGDVLLYDELSHASLFDGISQTCFHRGSDIQAFRFRHNEASHLEKLLEKFSKKKKGIIFVAIEGVYSMDGDLAPLPKIHRICEKYGATLVIDDAHGTGVMGKTGAGTAEHFGLHGKIDISIGTFSKTFGTTGGFIVAKKEVIDYLRFFSRSYMFSAHLPPSTVATVLAGIEVMEQEPELLSKLHENSAYLHEGLLQLGLNVTREASILPILIPGEVDIRQVNRRLHEEGIFLNSIEYPAVPKGEQRLRVSVMATHTKEDLDFTLFIFKKIQSEFEL